MNKFDDMIHGLQQDIEVPAEVWAKYTKVLSNLPDREGAEDAGTYSGRSGRRQSSPVAVKRRIWPAAVAAALVIGTVSVSAAVYLNWSRSLGEGLQATTEQRQVLEDNRMAAAIGQSVTQGDVTITAQQSIVDNYFAHLSFKIEGYELEAGEAPGFAGIDILVGDGQDIYNGGWSGSFYDGLVPGADGRAVHAEDGTPMEDGENISYTMEDGSLEYKILLMSDEKGSFIDKPVHVEFKDMGVYAGKAEDVVADAKGTWAFDWTMTGNDTVESFELNEFLGDSSAKVLNAELSPISISLAYEFPRQEETELGLDENGEEFVHTAYKEPPAFTGVRLKDGTVLNGLASGGSSGYADEDSDVWEMTVALNRVIDVDQVEELIFTRVYPEWEGYSVPVEKQ